MSKYTVTLLPGDGIGPEVTQAMVKCVDALNLDIKWESMPAGENALGEYNSLLPEVTIESIRKNKIAIKGPITTPVGKGFRSINVTIRQMFDLFACVRPIKTYLPDKLAKYKNIDLVIFRENTEDLYAGIEFELGDRKTEKIIAEINAMSDKKISAESAVSIKPISVFGTQRIVRAAFEYAVKNGRKSVNCVHKANIMKFTDGLFLKIFYDIAKEYEGRVEYWDTIVDNMCMQLVKVPQNYDVLVMENLYGDILSDLCAGLVGGLGLAAGANIGADIAVFEPTHGSAPKYAGQNKVNATATILSAVLMLRHLGETKAADILENAVIKIIQDGNYVTYDLKEDRNDPSAVGTQEMADAIVKEIQG